MTEQTAKYDTNANVGYVGDACPKNPNWPPTHDVEAICPHRGLCKYCKSCGYAQSPEPCGLNQDEYVRLFGQPSSNA